MKLAESVWQVETDNINVYIVIAADILEAIEKGRLLEQVTHGERKMHPGGGHLGTVIDAKLLYRLDAL